LRHAGQRRADGDVLAFGLDDAGAGDERGERGLRRLRDGLRDGRGLIAVDRGEHAEGEACDGQNRQSVFG
jgi:hypothetical protein